MSLEKTIVIAENLIDFIDNNEFDRVYTRIWSYIDSLEDIGDFTAALLKSDIDPLQYMTSVPQGYLFGQKIKKIAIPAHVTSIHRRAFAYCEVTEVTVSEGCRTLHDDAFYGCFNLHTIFIPSTVEELGDECFGATMLKTVFYNGTYQQWQNIIKGQDVFPVVGVRILCTDGTYTV